MCSETELYTFFFKLTHCRILSATMIELIMMDLVPGDVMILQILKKLEKLCEWIRHKD